jgi:hypothetical protein
MPFYLEQKRTKMAIKTGAEINFESGSALKIAGSQVTSSAAQLNDDVLTLDIADASAEAVYYMLCPYAGTITKIWTVIDSAVLTADVTLTAAIGVTAVTNGVVTITQAGSAAGDIDSATPTALNVVTAGQAVNLTVTGGGAAGTGPRIHVTMVITH